MSRAESPVTQLTNEELDQVQKYVIASFAAIVWYNSIELIALCLTTFKRYRGWYFWSLFIASSSLIPHGLGFIFFIYPLGVSPYASVTLIIVSWYCMVTGHSLILWSRLHLVVQARRLLRFLLVMILVDAVVFHVPTTVLLYGALEPNRRRFANGYRVMEHIQLIGFAVQECVISSIYIWETSKLLRLRPDRLHYTILTQLLGINIIILILDVAVVGIEYANLYALQVMFKPVAYSIKFKLEYAILGKLIQIARVSLSSDEPLSSNSQGADLSSSTQVSSHGNAPPAHDIPVLRSCSFCALCTGFRKYQRQRSRV
ncbi:hypothetical protein ABOM_008434 [Aspergillus bombycis]|uniref:DUF7703 domain-containing protein n=1 Tax=Aspergillus bombycis TaxID=109264 RepID=A0A1F7ZT64_9EURO|nr:hypothetical protein ABOM_008434 [Aspergillus bombycis]OGM42642.1 hypothetical protein ABOM_008434 [Aspergillus bombycis]